MTSSSGHHAPRPDLTDGHWAALLAAADTLIPASGPLPVPSQLDGYRERVITVLIARHDLKPALQSALTQIDPATADADVRRLDASNPELMHALGITVAGAYSIVPAVLEHIGYPGQHRNAPAYDASADEISTGILDPVMEAAPIIREVPAGRALPRL